MIQNKDELEQWHSKHDPWKYESSFDDLRRKEVLLSELPANKFESILDIGCGQGFITKELPGESVIGIDISANAINFAKKYETDRLKFIQASLFELPSMLTNTFDLIIITGVLYEQYIGNSKTLVYHIIDQILKHEGYLMSVHISSWYKIKFPYLLIKDYCYDYKQYLHKLELYIK